MIDATINKKYFTNKALTYGALIFCLVGVVVVFRQDISLLFMPDPETEWVYKSSFSLSGIKDDEHIISIKGFKASNYGLELMPGQEGSIVFAFKKKETQGGLLRVWFHGYKGGERPNAIKISIDNGKTYHKIAGTGDYIGEVFNLDPYVRGTERFLLLFESLNNTDYPSLVLERIQVIVPVGEKSKPPLPDIMKILGLVTVFVLGFNAILLKEKSFKEIGSTLGPALVIFLGAGLRWEKLTMISGLPLGPDASGYFSYAQKMDLISSYGFYSASFGVREPLYILIARLFGLFFGFSSTHLLFVSFFFSLVAIYLTYKVGREWFGWIAGVCAALVMALHPYLIELSTQGLRAECYTTLLLLFIYYSNVKKELGRWPRVVLSGVLVGSILLIRSEALPMLFAIMFCYPLILKSKWNYPQVAVVMLIGVSMYLPHLVSTYSKTGDPFYAVNFHTRFYRNLEFMDQPGFATGEELEEDGMYIGPEISPFEYYFKLHTPGQLIRGSLEGFVKTYFNMPLYFAFGKGNQRKVKHCLKELRDDKSISRFFESSGLIINVVISDFIDYFLAVVILTFFLIGLLLTGYKGYWALYLYILMFQLQTSYIASLGLNARLGVHAYPLVAICCGFAISFFIKSILKSFSTREKSP
jgi:hypothetical protein